MTQLAILKATPEGRVAKYRDFETEAEAAAHVDEWSNRFPKAFSTPQPEAPWSHWRIDMAGQRVTIDAPPAPEPEPEAVERRALRVVAQFADGEIEGAEAGTQIRGLLATQLEGARNGS